MKLFQVELRDFDEDGNVIPPDEEPPAPEEANCGGCNWSASHLYVLASSQETAQKIYEAGQGGLCGECMADMLSEGGYFIAEIVKTIKTGGA